MEDCFRYWLASVTSAAPEAVAAAWLPSAPATVPSPPPPPHAARNAVLTAAQHDFRRKALLSAFFDMIFSFRDLMKRNTYCVTVRVLPQKNSSTRKYFRMLRRTLSFTFSHAREMLPFLQAKQMQGKCKKHNRHNEIRREGDDRWRNEAQPG